MRHGASPTSASAALQQTASCVPARAPAASAQPTDAERLRAVGVLLEEPERADHLTVLLQPEMAGLRPADHARPAPGTRTPARRRRPLREASATRRASCCRDRSAHERLSAALCVMTGAIDYHTAPASVRARGPGRALRRPRRTRPPPCWRRAGAPSTSSPTPAEQRRVVGELDAQRRNHFLQLRLPAGVLGREAALQHVEHGGHRGRRTRRRAEQARDAAVGGGDDGGAELEHAALALARG